MRSHQKGERKCEVIAMGSLGWFIRDAMGMARKGTRVVTPHIPNDVRCAVDSCHCGKSIDDEFIMSAFWILGLASGEAVFIGHPKMGERQSTDPRHRS